MFGFGGVFGRKPRQFDYRPRYYDLEREAREQRRREVLGEDYADKYKSDDERAAEKRAYKPGVYIRNSAMQRRGIERSPRNNQTRVRRMAVILILLAGLAVWLMTSGGIDDFFARWLTK